jgi:adenylate kinase
MNLVFLGPPGVGKGTYASRIAPKLKIPHISTGDLFRDEIRNKTALGKKAETFMKKGNLVPDEITIGMLKKRIAKSDCKNGFILDGYPRTLEQASALDKITKVDKAINFQLRQEILIKKISARRICEKCGKIYNVADIKEGKLHMPPLLPKKPGICDDCKGKLYQRKDDSVEVVKDRLVVYEKQTKPLIDYYTKKKLLKNIDVIGGPDIMVPLIIKEIKK